MESISEVAQTTGAILPIEIGSITLVLGHFAFVVLASLATRNAWVRLEKCYFYFNFYSHFQTSIYNNLICSYPPT